MEKLEALKKIRKIIAERESEIDDILCVDAIRQPAAGLSEFPITDEEIEKTEEYAILKQLIKDNPKLNKQKCYDMVKECKPPFDKLDKEIANCVIARLFRDEAIRVVTGSKKKKKGDEYTVAQLVDEFIKETKTMYILRHWHKSWFEYKPKRGYIEISDCELEGRLAEFLASHHVYSESARHQAVAKEMMFRMRSPVACGISETVEQPSLLYQDENKHFKGIPAPSTFCFNGMQVDILREAMCMAGLSKKRYPPMEVDENFWSLDKVKYDYITEYQGKMPIWQKFLDDTLDMEDQIALQEMFGICVSDETRFEKFWFLAGEGGTGKGVTVSILKELIGRHNICNVLIDKLNQDFRVYPITECKVNIMGDMPEFSYGTLQEIEGMLKNVTGKGGTIDVNKKHVNVVREVPVRARFVFTTNHLPGFVDRSSGIWRRMIIIPYPDTEIPENKRDVQLSEKIVANELSAIMAWAVEGLANILKRGMPFESKKGLEQKNQLRAQNNHEEQFLKDENIIAGAGTVSVKDMYSDYKDWMLKNGYRPTSTSKMISRILKLIPSVKVEYKDYLGKRTQCFIGLHCGDAGLL